jgi:hypothetical protein
VVQRRNGTSFAFETGAQVFSFGDVFRQDLDGGG